MLSNPAACAVRTAVRACSAVWRLPIRQSSMSSNDWMPIESRLIPILRHAAAFSGVISPGLHSNVISPACDTGSAENRFVGRNLQQTGGSSAQVNGFCLACLLCLLGAAMPFLYQRIDILCPATELCG